jgi:hypothetical protein
LVHVKAEALGKLEVQRSDDLLEQPHRQSPDGGEAGALGSGCEPWPAPRRLSWVADFYRLAGSVAIQAGTLIVLNGKYSSSDQAASLERHALPCLQGGVNVWLSTDGSGRAASLRRQAGAAASSPAFTINGTLYRRRCLADRCTLKSHQSDSAAHYRFPT